MPNKNWKNFFSTTAELCCFSALASLSIGCVGMIIGGLKGVENPQYFFGLKNWYEGLILGGLTGLITPIIICSAFALIIACLTELYLFLNSRFPAKA